MLMEVKNQLKVTLLSIKYNLMREMLNKVSFLSNVFFMILNNAAFLIEWLVIFKIKDNIGGYTLNDIFLLWGMASLTYGVSHFFFYGATGLGKLIVDGKLDALLVQPKNVLIQALTLNVSTSAIGDMLYGYIMLFVYGFTIPRFLLFTFFGICGGLVMTCVYVILQTFCFYITNGDIVFDAGSRVFTNFTTYPDSIYKNVVKIILYTIIPVGLTIFIPVKLISHFNFEYFLLFICAIILLIIFTFKFFYSGLKRYSSSNLMISRI